MRAAVTDWTATMRVLCFGSPCRAIIAPRRRSGAGPTAASPRISVSCDSPQPDDFCFIQITDTHIGNAEALRQFAKQASKLPIPIPFVVNTGDLGGDACYDIKEARKIFDRYMGATSAFQQPLFNVPGNHDHVGFLRQGRPTRTTRYGARGSIGNCLVRCTIPGTGATCISWPSTAPGSPYQEKLGAEQLAWLKADLSFQPHDKPLVLFCHQSVVATKTCLGD